MRVSIWIKKKSIKTQTSYHQISEKMGTVLNLENISDQKFQSKIIFPIIKLFKVILGSRRWNWKFREKHFWNPNSELLLHSSYSFWPWLSTSGSWDLASPLPWKNCEKHFLYFYITEVRDSDFKNAFPGIFNFTVGILIQSFILEDLEWNRYQDRIPPYTEVLLLCREKAVQEVNHVFWIAF